MRKYLLAAAAAAAIASPAAARDGSPYVGVDAGALFPRDHNFSVSAATDGTTVVDYSRGLRLNYHMGYDADIVGGYDLGMFRIEGDSPTSGPASKSCVSSTRIW